MKYSVIEIDGGSIVVDGERQIRFVSSGSGDHAPNAQKQADEWNESQPGFTAPGMGTYNGPMPDEKPAEVLPTPTDGESAAAFAADMQPEQAATFKADLEKLTQDENQPPAIREWAAAQLAKL